MSDIKSKIKGVVKKGEIVIGNKRVVAALLNGNPKLVIISSNCPTEINERIAYYSQLSGIEYKEIDADSMELGSLCAKPFPIAVMAVIDAGESGILTE